MGRLKKTQFSHPWFRMAAAVVNCSDVTVKELQFGLFVREVFLPSWGHGSETAP